MLNVYFVRRSGCQMTPDDCTSNWWSSIWLTMKMRPIRWSLWNFGSKATFANALGPGNSIISNKNVNSPFQYAVLSVHFTFVQLTLKHSLSMAIISLWLKSKSSTAGGIPIFALIKFSSLFSIQIYKWFCSQFSCWLFLTYSWPYSVPNKGCNCTFSGIVALVARVIQAP